MASHTHLKQLIDTAPVRQVPLFPDDVVRLIKSGKASEREVTSFEIRAVVRGLRQPERWRKRGHHYDSVCWWMGEREYQCQWYPDGNYLVFTERATHTARECGWKDDEIVTFSHVPDGRRLSDVVAREDGIVSVHPADRVAEQNNDASDAQALKQYKLPLSATCTLGGAARHATQLVGWWLLEHFEISDRKSSMFYNSKFMDMINKRVLDTLVPPVQ